MLSNEELSQKVLRFRIKHGMILEELALKSGVSYPTVGKIERGKDNVTQKSRMRLLMFMEDYENDLETINKKD